MLASAVKNDNQLVSAEMLVVSDVAGFIKTGQ